MEMDDDYKDFIENITYPHHMKKSHNISYYSVSILGKLYDISREIVKNIPSPSFSIPNIDRNSVNYSRSEYIGHSSTEIEIDCFNKKQNDHDDDDHDDDDDDDDDDDNYVGIERDVFGCDELFYVAGTEAEEVCSAVHHTTTHIIPTSSSAYPPSSSSSSLSSSSMCNSTSAASQPQPPAPAPIPVPAYVPAYVPTSLPLPLPVYAHIPVPTSPLHALALASIAMDPDLQSIRSQDFLQISMRIYNRYKTLNIRTLHSLP